MFKLTSNKLTDQYLCYLVFPKSRKGTIVFRNNILSTKKFGFQIGYSVHHKNTQLPDQIHRSFEKNEYAFDVFIILSPAFCTANQSMLLKKTRAVL